MRRVGPLDELCTLSRNLSISAPVIPEARYAPITVIDPTCTTTAWWSCLAILFSSLDLIPGLNNTVTPPLHLPCVPTLGGLARGVSLSLSFSLSTRDHDDFLE